MTELSWAETKRHVHERANGCCEYCQSCEYNTAQAMHVEHIIPDGGDDLINLCLSCASCNLSKASATKALDPQTQKIVSLFNPRTQEWSEHFEWIDQGLRIKGKSVTGRATIIRLKMNQDRFVVARRNWIRLGTHPPQ